MTDKERREGDALEKLIQTAYDFSDEQLLAELEEAEATLSDSDFPGIEDRIYQKLKARMAEEEDNSETTAEETPTTAPVVALAAEEKKVVRFGKKKVLVVGILAAAFVGMLGVTAIGEKNYFFRSREKDRGIVFNNDRNIQYIGDIEVAYEKLKEEIEIPILKLEYVPTEMKLQKIEVDENSVIFIFEYNKKTIHFVQEKLYKEASIGINSDRELVEEIYNDWLSQNVLLEKEVLENGEQGYSFSLNIENARYRFMGQLPEEEVKKIIKNLRI